MTQRVLADAANIHEQKMLGLQAQRDSAVERAGAISRVGEGAGNLIYKMRNPPPKDKNKTLNPWNLNLGSFGADYTIPKNISNIDWNSRGEYQFNPDLPNFNFGIEPSDITFSGNIF